MKEFALTNRKGESFVVRVDDEDAPLMRAHQWRVTRHPRSGNLLVVRGRARVILHREIMKAPPGVVVDHIDHDRLNNCRSNLRLCSPRENNRNRMPNRGASSRFKGVTWHPTLSKWMARISTTYIGLFEDEEDAARAYDIAAMERWGEFAHTNADMGLYQV